MVKNIILFDDDKRDHLLPLVYTQPVGELRVGIMTIREKWEKRLNGRVSYITQDYLADKFPLNVEDDNIVINGGVCPSPMLCRLIEELEFNEALLKGDALIAARLDAQQFSRLMRDEEVDSLKGFDLEDTPFIHIEYPYDIFRHNGIALQEDYDWLTLNRESQFISSTNQVMGRENIFLEEGAKVECAILNATNGPIYIGKDAEIMEGAIVRGGLAMNEKSVLKMGAKIYGATTLGPYCKVGGEVSNVVFSGYSNKGHDGYLGNSVIGAWCNIGADSNNSNLKNNYAKVKLWDYPSKKFKPTGLQFCGLIMGDHSKCGINTMFNTGTVVGVASNIYGAGFPRNFIPSFSWGGASGFMTHKLEKALETAKIMMARRGIELSEHDREIFAYILGKSTEYRPWEAKSNS